MPVVPIPGDRLRLRSTVRKFLAARWHPTSVLGRWLTLSIVACLVLVWMFAGLLEEVLDDDQLVRWDLQAYGWLHAHATPGGSRAFQLLTELGSAGVWTTVLVVALWLWHRRQRSLLTLWLLANVGGRLIQFTLKALVHRSRPQYAAAYLEQHSYSFPSGHAMGATICYVVLAFVVCTTLSWTGARRLIAYTVAAVLAGAIGASRLYLGVHYPSDVAAGFLAGGAWVTACLTVVRLWSHKVTVSSAFASD